MKPMPCNQIGVIIPAAGQGKRMGRRGNKLFFPLTGVPILVFSLLLFEECPLVQEIVIPAAEGERGLIEDLARQYDLTKVKKIVTGGPERQDSVHNALKALAADIDKVVIHDGARPLLTSRQLTEFLTSGCQELAAVMAVPAKDTIKRANEEGFVLETPPRTQLWLVQTPQLFERGLLEKAHEEAAIAHFTGTDDASLVERLNVPVKILRGSYENIKITTPEDLILAEAIIRRREREVR